MILAPAFAPPVFAPAGIPPANAWPPGFLAQPQLERPVVLLRPPQRCAARGRGLFGWPRFASALARKDPPKAPPWAAQLPAHVQQATGLFHLAPVCRRV